MFAQHHVLWNVFNGNLQDTNKTLVRVRVRVRYVCFSVHELV